MVTFGNKTYSLENEHLTSPGLTTLDQVMAH